jgi:hypothetical protein
VDFCIHCKKFRHNVDHCWDRHLELRETSIRTHKSKQESQANNDANSESRKKGKMVERYKYPSPTFNEEHSRVMELIKRTIPCTFCGSHNHCVAVLWKKKVYGKKIMATRSTPRQDDATL